jgi:hypothetical protein
MHGSDNHACSAVGCTIPRLKCADILSCSVVRIQAESCATLSKSCQCKRQARKDAWPPMQQPVATMYLVPPGAWVPKWKR